MRRAGAGLPRAVAAFGRAARAGPPFRTDDPEPTDTGHWEISAPALDAAGVGRRSDGGFGAAFLGERPSRRNRAGVALVGAGAVLVAL